MKLFALWRMIHRTTCLLTAHAPPPLIYARFADPYTLYNCPPPSQHLRCTYIGEYNEYTCGEHSQSCITIMYSVYTNDIQFRDKTYPRFWGFLANMYIYMWITHARSLLFAARVLEYVTHTHTRTTTAIDF